MSANTLVAPTSSAHEADATYVKSAVKTASPGPISYTRKASTSASVPFAQATQCLRPTYSASSASKSLTGLPKMKAVESITS